jgi:hypothetical protein
MEEIKIVFPQLITAKSFPFTHAKIFLSRESEKRLKSVTCQSLKSEIIIGCENINL